MNRSRWNSTRSNIRKRAVKKVDRLFHSLHEEQSCSLGVSEDIAFIPVSSPDSELVSNGESKSTSDEDSDQGSHDDGQGSQKDSLAECLRDWATQFSISLVALSALLSILKTHHSTLPRDARSLLKTTTSYTVVALAGGSFYYFGVLNRFFKIFERLSLIVPSHHVFKLQLNIDGLPIFKSSAVQFWPILGMLQGYTKTPLLIALFSGNSKPWSLSEYLKDLVCELKTLNRGFVVNSKTFFLTVCSVICDAPARAFVKGIKSHNAYSGCDKCVQPGIYIRNRMTFPEMNPALRTDASFINLEDEDHHLVSSPLSETTVAMVSGFPHDYMHLVCLGVVRHLLDLWMGTCGPLCCRISSRQASLISEKLIALRAYIPSEFVRRPRALAERLRWKATELRQFLLYTGPVVLRNVLPTEVYQNFMLLSVGIYILASPVYCLRLNDMAKTLLASFVQHFRELYGHEFVVYNVHGLIHLSDDVIIHGHLDLFSGFPYENYLKQLKKMVRKPNSPLPQVIRRLSEVVSSSGDGDISLRSKKTLKMQHSIGPVPMSFQGKVCQFKELVIDEFVIGTSERNCCVKVNNTIALVQNIIVTEGEEFVVYKEYRHVDSFFDYPVDSADLGICVVSDLSPNLQYFKLEAGNMQKCVRLPVEFGFVVIPLLHADSS